MLIVRVNCSARRRLFVLRLPHFTWSTRLTRWSTLPAILRRIMYHGDYSKLRFIPGAMLAGIIPITVMYAKSEDIPSITKHADQLYENSKMQEFYDYMMQFKDIQSDEIQWRCSRACYKLSILPSTDKKEAGRLAHACLDFAKRAGELNNDNFQCHKWIGIGYVAVGDHDGLKIKIQNAWKVKEHILKAIELNPTEPTTRHLLGRWCYVISDVSWVERQIGAVVFATPPTATFEEALSYFEKGEELQPGFYSANWLYLGKTYLKLGQKDKARHWLQKAADYKPKNQEDIDAQREAETLFKKL